MYTRKAEMTINEKIFNIINEKNLKQSELAQLLNVEKSVITAWKRRGTNPPAEYLVQICTFLDISINELLNIPHTELTENQKELLTYFDKLTEREQIKWIARIQDAAEQSSPNTVDTKIS